MKKKINKTQFTDYIKKIIKEEVETEKSSIEWDGDDVVLTLYRDDVKVDVMKLSYLEAIGGKQTDNNEAYVEYLFTEKNLMKIVKNVVKKVFNKSID